MTTVVALIDELIDHLENLKKEGYKYVIATNELIGSQYAPSKHNIYFRLTFGFPSVAFNHANLARILDAQRMAILVFKDTNDFGEEALKIIDEKEGKSIDNA